MKNKKSIIFLIVGIILLIGGYLIYPLVSPLFIDKKVSEDPIVNINSAPESGVAGTDQDAYSHIQGSFTGFDRIHTGTGTVQVIMNKDSHVVRFEPDFSVQNGPDLYVGFGKDGKYIEGSEIAPLKGNIGSQNYVMEGKFDSEKYNEVWIWCKKFSTPFARAVLKI